MMTEDNIKRLRCISSNLCVGTRCYNRTCVCTKIYDEMTLINKNSEHLLRSLPTRDLSYCSFFTMMLVSKGCPSAEKECLVSKRQALFLATFYPQVNDNNWRMYLQPD